MKYRHDSVFAGQGSREDQFESSLRGLTVDPGDRTYVVGDSTVKIFDPSGTYAGGWETESPGFSVEVTQEEVYIGQEGRLAVYDLSGRLLTTWRDPQRLGRVTAVEVSNDQVIFADALDRCLRRYDREGRFINNIGEDNRMKGFNIPNGILDFSVDSRGIIHACNPGKHRVERYTAEGELLGHIGRFDGVSPEGFAGCCNPTNVAVDVEGRVYVTEKAGPRAKVYDSEGHLLAVIGKDEFDPGCKNMDLAVDSRGRVLVSDPVRLQIHVFVIEEGGTARHEREETA